jgi:predicted nucleic acid-binding protein
VALSALDTNGYVEILRGGPRDAAIRAALAAAGVRLVVLMPVVAELLQGTRRPAEERVILQRFVEPVPLARRVVATPAEWAATGSRVAAMRRAGEDPRELARRSFWLDVHVAHLCRARGITLLTDDGDHARIARHVRHTTAPLPS